MAGRQKVRRLEVRKLLGCGRQEVLTTEREAGERTLAYHHLLSLT